VQLLNHNLQAVAMKVTLAWWIGCLLGVAASATRLRFQRKPSALSAIQASKSACHDKMSKSECATAMAQEIVGRSKACFQQHSTDEDSYVACTHQFCSQQCGSKSASCQGFCVDRASPLFQKFAAKLPTSFAPPAAPQLSLAHMNKAQLVAQAKQAQNEEEEAMADLQKAHDRMRHLNAEIAEKAKREIQHGDPAKGRAKLAKVKQLSKMEENIETHIKAVEQMRGQLQQRAKMQSANAAGAAGASFLQEPTESSAETASAAKEVDTQDTKAQDASVDTEKDPEASDIKNAVARAFSRLHAATAEFAKQKTN